MIDSSKGVLKEEGKTATNETKYLTKEKQKTYPFPNSRLKGAFIYLKNLRRCIPCDNKTSVKPQITRNMKNKIYIIKSIYTYNENEEEQYFCSNEFLTP